MTSGEATVRRAPDVAFVSIAVETRARTPRETQQLNADAMSAVQQRVAKAAGLTKRTKPHTLRHSYANRLLDGGANLFHVKELMGHESLATTEKYLHAQASRLKADVDRL